MNKLLKNSRGFTLIEIIIAMAITVVVVGAISSMVLVAYKSYYNVESNNSVVNGTNSVTEAIRELTFDTTGAEISQITAQPTFEPNYDYIYCLDNGIYLNGGLIQSAAGMGIATLNLEFSKDTSSPDVLKYRIEAIDENGNDRGQSMNTFLNACESGVSGETVGNCIKFTKADTP